MEANQKQRNPEVVGMISELEAEFANIVKDSPTTIMLTNKMKKFMTLIEDKTMAKCANQVAELDKYAKMELQDGRYELKKFPGKEAEADRAIEALQICQANYSNYLLALNMFSQYNVTLLSTSTEHCIDDCEKKFPVAGNKTELKNCIRKCYDHTYKYVLKSAEDLLSTQIDIANEELKKL